MLASLASISTLAVILLAALGIGAPLLRWLKVEHRDRLEMSVWSLALGLVASGTLLGLLGLCGWLYRPLIGVLTIAGALNGLRTLSQGSPLRLNRRGGKELRSPPAMFLSGIGILAGTAGFAALVSALAPPTAGDALCYHLELPKTFLADRGLIFSSYNDNSAFPLLVEMWYLWALALEGGVAAQLVHWSLGILLALATVLLATPILGRTGAWAAGGVILLVPCVTNQMSAPLNDVALATFTTLALAAWRKSSRATPSPVADARSTNVPASGPSTNARWAVLAGLMLGGALATKFTAFVMIAAVATTWPADLLSQPLDRRRRVFATAAMLLVAGSVAGMWYLRAAWHWGNPVYPFFSEYLGEPGPEGLPQSKTPLGADLLSIITAPWQWTFYPERFGGRGYQFGGLFLACLPALLVTRRLRGLGSLLVIAFVYAAVWYALRQNLRFLLPIVPLLAVAFVWLLMELRRFPQWPRYLITAACSCLLLAQAAVPVLRCRQHLPVAIGLETRDEYLARTEPTYTIAQVANRLLPADARLLSQDYRAFYFDCPVTRESIFRRREAYDQQLAAPGDLSRVLLAAGFSHLLLAESTGGGIRYRGNLRRLADQQSALDTQGLNCLYECRFADSDGATRRYRLIELR